MLIQGVTAGFSAIKRPQSRSWLHGCKGTLTTALLLREFVRWTQLQNPLPWSISFNDRLVMILSRNVSCSSLSLFSCVVFEAVQESTEYLD